MNASELDDLVKELGRFGTDHQTVEAKRARDALPESTHETLSAFGNTGGGILILGVAEDQGVFEVAGVADAGQIQSDLRALCGQMEPPLRATIELVAHPNGNVVVCRIPGVLRQQRPCHLASRPPEDSSYVRVGDGDTKLTRDQVLHMLADATLTDYSVSPAPAGSDLDPGLREQLLTSLRASSHRLDGRDDETLLAHVNALDPDGQPTLAAMLVIGVNPQGTLAPSRVDYRVLPRVGDPQGTRFTGRHAEGVVGELLDELLTWVRGDLGDIQVVRDGSVYNETQIPIEAVREVLSNALIHRSFAPGLRERRVVVELSAEALTVTSPGNLFYGTDPDLLGLTSMSSVRNTSLVRIADHMTTPSGARIVESQTSGIAAADVACHLFGGVPILFVDLPDSFQAHLIRGATDTSWAIGRIGDAKLQDHQVAVRLVSVAQRLSELHEVYPELRGTAMDAAYAARTLAPCSREVAAARLVELEQAGLMHKLVIGRRPAWVLTEGTRPESVPATAAAKPAEPGRRRDRVPDLLAAIARSSGGELSAAEIGSALVLTSPTSRARWIGRARDRGLIVATRENPFDPLNTYELTDEGRQVLNASA